MFDLFLDIPFVSLLIKFMIASSLLLSAVWVMEKIKLINTPDLAELAWKAAIAGSFLALLPVANFMSSTVVIESSPAAALIEDINQHRPFGGVQQSTNTVFKDASSADFGVATGGNPTTDAAPTDQITRILPNSSSTTPDFSFPADDKLLQNSDLAKKLEKAKQKAFAFEMPESPLANQVTGTTNTAAETDTAPIDITEGDSETPIKNRIWFSAADLRTKDLAVLGWLALASLAVSVLMLSYRSAVKNLGSRSRVHAEDPANQTLRAVCAKADIKHVPYLSRSNNIQSPVCLPRREICLPNWAFEAMPDTEFKSLLAHELGHMVRRDPIMLMALQLLSRIFFFQPLFILARRRLTDIAELAADEWAAHQAADSRAVANALFTCATKINETRQIQWGLAMAGNKSILKQRVERLINAQSQPFKNAGLTAKTTLSLGVIGLSLGLPSIEFAGAMNAENPMENEFHVPAISPVAPRAPVPSSSSSSSSSPMSPMSPLSPTRALAPSAAMHPHNRHFIENDDNNSGSIQWYDDDRSVSATWQGNFSINDADDFIIAEDADGYLRLNSIEDGIKRSIKFEMDDKKQTSVYWKDGKKHELDADGKAWLKSAIRMLINSGFGAEERVARILKKDKVKGVLKEVGRFESDYIRRIYLTFLMDKTNLKAKEILQVVKITATFESDFEKRLTLSVLLTDEKVSDKILPKVLAVAKGFNSDFEKRLLVSYYVSELKLNDKTTDVVIEIAEDMDSDFELRLLLTSTLTDAKLSNKNVEKIFDMAIHNMDSDFEKRMILTSFSSQFGKSDKAVSKVLAATGTMDSDFETRLMLSALIGKAKLNEKNWLAAIKIAADIDSNFEKSRALAHMRGEIPKGNKKIGAALDEAVKNIDQHFSGSVYIEKDETTDSEHHREFFSAERADARARRDEARALRDQLRAEQDVKRSQLDMQREQVREKAELMREKSEMMREISREFSEAKREIDREISRLQRDISRADKGMKLELSRVIKQLRQTKKDLAKQLEQEKASIALEYAFERQRLAQQAVK